MVRQSYPIFILLILITLTHTDESVHSTNATDEITKLENQELIHLNSTQSASNETHHDIPTQNITELKKEEEAISHIEDNEKFTQNLIKEMGFDQGIIKKEPFKKFLLRLITKDEEIDQSEIDFYNEVIEKIGKDIPNEFDHSKLHDHIDHSKFVTALDSVIAEKYGPDVLKEIQSDNGDEKERTDL